MHLTETSEMRYVSAQVMVNFRSDQFSVSLLFWLVKCFRDS